MRGIASETLRLMPEYPWPGNVRELQNLVERAVVLSTGPVLNLNPRLLSPASFADPAVESLKPTKPQVTPELPAQRRDQLSWEVERRHILAVLEQTDWVIEGPEGAANIFKLNPSTIRSRMKRLGIACSSMSSGG